MKPQTTATFKAFLNVILSRAKVKSSPRSTNQILADPFLIISSHLHLVLLSLTFHHNTLYTVHLSPLRATCPAQLILLAWRPMSDEIDESILQNT